MDCLRLGIDVGSTTSKVVLAGQDGRVLFSDYARHHTRTRETLLGQLERIEADYGDRPLRAAFTGSAGMGLAENNFPHLPHLHVAAVALATVAGFISMLPGGAVVREAVLTELMIPYLGGGAALIAAVLLRLVWLTAELCIAGGLCLTPCKKLTVQNE